MERQVAATTAYKFIMKLTEVSNETFNETAQLSEFLWVFTHTHTHTPLSFTSCLECVCVTQLHFLSCGFLPCVWGSSQRLHFLVPMPLLRRPRKALLQGFTIVSGPLFLQKVLLVEFPSVREGKWCPFWHAIKENKTEDLYQSYWFFFFFSMSVFINSTKTCLLKFPQHWYVNVKTSFPLTKVTPFHVNNISVLKFLQFQIWLQGGHFMDKNAILFS